MLLSNNVMVFKAMLCFLDIPNKPDPKKDHIPLRYELIDKLNEIIAEAKDERTTITFQSRNLALRDEFSGVCEHMAEMYTNLAAFTKVIPDSLNSEQQEQAIIWWDNLTMVERSLLNIKYHHTIFKDKGIVGLSTETIEAVYIEEMIKSS